MLFKTPKRKVKQTDLRAGIVLNMVKPRSGITNDVRGLLETMEIGLLNTVIHDRVSIARSSMISGLLQSNDQKAKDEITSLEEEVVDLISV